MKKSGVIIAIGLVIVFFGQVAAAILTASPTFDEPNWVAIAWYLTHYWTWQGDYHVFMHPPLTFYLHGLPLRALEGWVDAPESGPPEGDLADDFPYPYSAIWRYETVFTIAKLCLLPISALLLWYVYRWAKELYGVQAAVFALGLYAMNPWLIAQATIIGTDLAIACGMFITVYYVWRFLHKPSLRNSVWTGLAFGLTLLTRVSAILIVPMSLALGGGLLLRQHFSASTADSSAYRQPAPGQGRRILIGSVIALVLALVVVAAGYLFDMQPVRAFRPEQEQDVLFKMFQHTPIPLGAYLNSIRLPQSFLFWMKRSAFLAGQHLTATVWYANLLALLLKNPLPFVIFLLVSLGAWRTWTSDHVLALLLPAVIVLGVFSFWFPVQGFRFVLPIYPFLIVWMSRIVTWNAMKKPVIRIIFGVLIGWYLLSGALAMPDYLAYCNELIGGTAQGYRWFADADYDWGQDLKRLGRYLQGYDGPPVRLAYFGSGIPEYYGIRANPLQEPEGCQPTAGLIAISATRLQGVYEQNQDCYAWLAGYEPITRIGETIFVYAIHPHEISGP